MARSRRQMIQTLTVVTDIHCECCDQVVNTEDAVIVTGLEDLSGVYCSSDCLFHTLLGDRTDERTYFLVMELVNL
jgi:hypothetical protein